jgi:predicted secreted protein
MGKRHDFIVPGYSINKLTVVREGKSNRTGKYWICRCDCGKETELVGSLLNPKNKKVRQTCGCERYENNKNGTKNISGTFFGRIKENALRRKKSFSITIEYLQELWDKQDGRCALSNLPIFLNLGKKYQGHSASLDRIDSSKGYLVGNVQWVHRDVNFMKQSLSDGDFIFLCEIVVEYHKSTGCLENR